MYMDCGQPGPDDCYGDMFAPSTNAYTSLGDWHVLEMMIKPNTPNVADGSQTFWIDGKKIYTAGGINWRTTASLRLNQVGVYLYIHNVPANTTDILDIDNVIISTKYIGPAPCLDGAAISAPCLCGGAADPNSASNVHASGYCCQGKWQATACGGPKPDAAVPKPDAAAPKSDALVPKPDAGELDASARDSAGTDGPPLDVSATNFEAGEPVPDGPAAGSDGGGSLHADPGCSCELSGGDSPGGTIAFFFLLGLGLLVGRRGEPKVPPI
jgi:MYXO-CTERM domain-containing protein